MKEQLNQNIGTTLYGAGGHCKVVMDILESMGITVDLIVDDNPTSAAFMSIPCTTPLSKYGNVIVTIGNCQIRKRIAESINVKSFATAIHPSSIISPYSTIDIGTVVMQGVVVQSCASIGKHCIINTKASVDHDCRIGDYVHIAPGATLSGNVEVGECSWIGVGACVKQGIKIGKNCMIGAGSVVVKDIPDGSTAYGNPAKIINNKHNMQNISKLGGVILPLFITWLHKTDEYAA